MSKKTAKQIIPFVLLVAVALVAMFVKPIADYVPGEKDPQYNSADIAWVLVSTAIVFFIPVDVCGHYSVSCSRSVSRKDPIHFFYSLYCFILLISICTSSALELASGWIPC